MTNMTEECDACGFETKLESYSRHYQFQETYKKRNEEPPKMKLCDICSGSLNGNAYDFGPQLYPEMNVMRMLAYCTNVIISKLTEDKKHGE